MIKRILLASLMLFASILSSLLPAFPASAASLYDTAYQPTDEIHEYYPFGSYQCPTKTDLSTSWSSYITDESKWQFGQTTWAPAMKQSLQNAFAHGRWGVSMTLNNNGATDGNHIAQVTVFWTEDTSLSLEWLSDGGTKYVRTNSVKAAIITCAKLYSGGNDQPLALPVEWDGTTIVPRQVMVSNSNPYSPSGAYDTVTKNFFVYTDHPNYPPDYAGPSIPASHNPKPDFYVPYILNVDDKKLTIAPKPADTGGKCWKWASTLVKKGTSTSDNFADWEVISETDYLASNEPAELKARDYGNDYAIGMMPYNCDAPAVPISDSYNLKLERIFPLKIDGSSYILDSDDLNCDNGGICEQPSPYEDCSTYGTDLIGGLGCVMRNFGVFLRSLFVTLFVPTPGFLKDYFTEFKEFINTKFGFLIWPLTWSVDFVSAFFNGVNGTNNICNWSFGNIFNSDFKLNFCSLEQNFPTAFNTARYMIQAFTVFVLVSGLYTHYRRTLKT